MNIAIDFDGTFDRDTIAWKEVVQVLIERGHRVFMVTSRNVDDKQLVRQWAECTGIDRSRIICTNGTAKRWFCGQRGLKIDIWIDDDPGSIENGK
jgi:hydroxymethylpyrimidine pyrophosphatase-like HAD family hydrolase